MRSTPALFVTATDTNAGKTHFCALLLRSAARAGRALRVVKPIGCGDDGDARCLEAETVPPRPREEINWRQLALPAAPSVAAAAEGTRLDPAELVAWCQAAADGPEPLVVEGVGGWMVPIDGTWCVADWAQELAWPVLLVVADRLGCLNHTLLTVRDLQKRGVPLAGIVLNGGPWSEEAAGLDLGHTHVLQHAFDLPVLGRIPPGAETLPPEVELAVWKMLEPGGQSGQ
jgi:dethiobiotin synthetase